MGRSQQTCLLLLCLLLSAGCATLPKPGQNLYSHDSEADRLNSEFWLYMPAGRTSTRLPLLLFLHGSGERGDDPDLVTVHGPPKRLRNGHELPFIVVSPQLPAGARWDSDALMALVDHVRSIAPVDDSRLYVTGLSLGGHGTWQLAADYPQRLAAIAPVAGRGDPATACRFASVPVWAFHGARDTVVPVAGSTDMAAALRECGSDPRVTIYADAGHDSWTRTYENAELYEWLLRQRRER